MASSISPANTCEDQMGWLCHQTWTKKEREKKKERNKEKNERVKDTKEGQKKKNLFLINLVDFKKKSMHATTNVSVFHF